MGWMKEGKSGDWSEGGRREEGGVASGEARRCEWEVGGIWVRKYGG